MLLGGIEVADLHRSRYMLSAVVSEDLPASTIDEAILCWRKQGRETIRIASENPHLADHYARSAQIGRYSIMPVAGASEGFVPEDCEILIEGTETGRSLIANKLKVIDQITVSTNCLIARQDWPLSPGARVMPREIAPTSGDDSDPANRRMFVTPMRCN